MKITEEQKQTMISTWERAYLVTLGNVASFKRRLRELKEWDKPLHDRNVSLEGWIEYDCKVLALESLIK